MKIWLLSQTNHLLQLKFWLVGGSGNIEWIVEEVNHRYQSIMDGLVTSYRNEDLVTLYIPLVAWLFTLANHFLLIFIQVV